VELGVEPHQLVGVFPFFSKTFLYALMLSSSFFNIASVMCSVARYAA
jgi:hypothetical protein